MLQPVLIVEDSATQLEVMKNLVELFGFAVHTASSAEEALEKCAVLKFAVILMDIGIPSVDGFECCKRLRVRERQQQGEHVPVVVVTARTVDRTFERACEAAEVNDYLSKPFEAEALRKIFLRHTYTPRVPNLRLLPGYVDRSQGG